MGRSSTREGAKRRHETAGNPHGDRLGGRPRLPE